MLKSTLLSACALTALLSGCSSGISNSDSVKLAYSQAQAVNHIHQEVRNSLAAASEKPSAAKPARILWQVPETQENGVTIRAHTVPVPIEDAPVKISTR